MTSLNTETVFVVDDDKIIRQQLLRLLEKAGFSAQPFASASELLAAIDATRSGCLLLDVNMPGMPGTDAAALILQAHPQVRIAIFSANIQEAVQTRAQQLGAVFVAKPVTEKSIAQALQYFAG